MSTPALRIGIVEDQALVLKLLADLCRHRFGWEVVIAAKDAGSARNAISVTQPDAMLIDINLPDEDGITLALAIKQSHPTIKLIILSAECTEFTIFRVRQCGLHGYVDKNSDPDQILSALQSALVEGIPYFSPVVRTVANTTAIDSHAFNKVLSAREQELLPILGMGHSDTEIAILKAIAPETARKHRENIMRKLGLKSTPELVHYCIDKGFLQIRPDGQIRPTLTCPPFTSSS